MKYIEILSRILKFLGWFSIVIGVLLLIQSIFTHTVSLLSGLYITQQFLSGLVDLTLARGLIKREKWAWYTGFAIFTLWFFFGIIAGFLFKSSVIISFSFIYIIFLGLLIKGKQPFIEQPKKKFVEWFSKPYFIFVVIGTFISYLIFGGILIYLSSQKSISQKMVVQLPPESIEARPVELEVYKNEKYNFAIKYFTDKLAIEKDYETKRLANNSRLLFYAFFYDSNYGVNTDKTKSIPVFMIEVFECKEKDLDVCLSPSQVTYGPQRYESGTFIGTGSGYIFDSTDASIDAQKISISWRSQEEMKGITILKNQFVYVILARTKAKNFKPIPQKVIDQILSTFKFIE
ncbi:hypothetical protein ANME2D_02473 [Candidatus Methanoperedens nitroreducens]|uniref:Uncharacterized protein n=1 Tax=Candidatus Methanoperedens nitratireducens TaxID=1392998 RepID=A0A062UW80_9EURY|nr:hypothetical protein [Candidatus Methanoperedens nitroreducens]KCZ71271.1 hypothetical protein ANME2D_02473 [Candidatus Methanoperedens nitroreducens]MDJ1420304.1 hypothetical protein [Candidatus Methanoperedens sp.]